MTEDNVKYFISRINKLKPEQKALFGKMNVNQMVCHCTDLLRVALGILKATEYDMVDPKEIILLSKSGKPVPTPKEFDQVEGGGTKPTTLENDKKVLKELLLEFSRLEDGFSYAPHPYFGKIGKKRWNEITAYHLNHHLEQFNV